VAVTVTEDEVHGYAGKTLTGCLGSDIVARYGQTGNSSPQRVCRDGIRKDVQSDRLPVGQAQGYAGVEVVDVT
jgi:hypothetical protein